MKELRAVYPEKKVYTQQVGPGCCFGALALMLRFYFEVTIINIKLTQTKNYQKINQGWAERLFLALTTHYLYFLFYLYELCKFGYRVTKMRSLIRLPQNYVLHL